MRITPLEYKAIKYAVKDVEGQVYLFGSRLDDTAKGGDIDLLIFTDAPSLKLSCRIAAKFRMICDEKIDVVLMPKENRDAEQNAFLNSIAKEKLT